VFCVVKKLFCPLHQVIRLSNCKNVNKYLYLYLYCSAGSPAVFYPSAPASGSVVEPSNVICYYDPVSGGIFSALPGLPGYDVTNSAYLYGGAGGVGVPVMPSAGYGLPARAGASATGHSLAMLTQQQPHYVQRLA